MRLLFLVFMAFLLSTSVNVRADEATSAQRPIQALLVTGGCCHDYDRQKLILTRGISARANVRWTVVQQGGKTTNTAIPLYSDPNWADGFDIIVHNECFAGVTDPAFVDRILKPHREGKPAILIHCAMHCYRVKDDRWFRFVGLQSPGHGPHYAYTAEVAMPDHPIMAGMGKSFEVFKGELYHAEKVFPSATPLAQAKRRSDGKPQVCVWTNDYHGTKVFATTMGHYNETMAQPKYLDMMTKGLLWAVGRDPESDFHTATKQADADLQALVAAPVPTVGSHALPQNCCGEGNLAYQKPVSSKSEQKDNFRKHLTDGRLDTRWCASGSQTNEWVTVDLQKPAHVRAIRLHWEKREGISYRYIVETSADNKQWTQVVDASKNKKPGGIRAHQIDAPKTRYIRTTFLGATRNLWGSLWELEASADKLPEIATVVPPVTGPVSTVKDVRTPPGFEVRLFGSPPEVNYPVCLTAAATGEVFVGVDEQGSLGKEPGRGKVLRCLDTDGDGVADQVNEFAKMDHPRGLIYDHGSLWVLHPPYLTLFRDTDGDGVSDESEVLIEGISTNEVKRRGADHTTNGIRMGIDGWIYIAVGDFGFHRAVAKDGTTLSKRGGGIVRIRPDGTEMEVYAWGLRNIMDVAIDPYMNVFTRDNTNDGGGWDIRLSHILQSANYGYPSLYKNFTTEIMPPLADYGGGSGCGSMFFQDDRWPVGYRRLLLTCDWGRSEVFSHDLPARGATFAAQQDTFLKLPRPTDIDVDASGRMYVSSWKNGKFSYGGPNVGFVAQVIPADFVPKPVPEVNGMAPEALVELLTHPSAAMRMHVQRALLRTPASAEALARFAADGAKPLVSRVAAIYTYKQLLGKRANAELRQLASDAQIREHCIRALADRKAQVAEDDWQFLLTALQDASPRVRSAALVGLGRIGSSLAAMPVLALTPRTGEAVPAEGDLWRQPDPGRVLSHLAIQTLADLRAVDACLAALETPYREGALAALKRMHSPQVVTGLFGVLGKSRDETLRRQVWTTLIRLYHREGDFTEKSPGWWGTRPDTTGPYYDRVTWDESERIAAAIRVAFAEADEKLATHLRTELQRHRINLKGISSVEAPVKELDQPIAVPAVDPKNPRQIANREYQDVLAVTMPLEGDAENGKKLFRAQSCIHCHTFANGQLPKGPHLVDIGKRYKKQELVESIVDPSKKIAQGFDTWGFIMESGKIFTGFVVRESAETVTIRQADGISRELIQDEVEERVKQEVSMMPKGIVGNLTPQQLADIIAYLQTLH